ncbi:MAG: GAF domain-containing protein, partial [Nitrospirae bacterium]|nr:GAF domain-containing protein [Nitrospirota bacterium]
QTVEKTFFRARYDAYKILRKFTEDIITITDFKELLDSIINTFVKTLKIDKASIALFDEEIKRFKLQSSHGLKEELVKKLSLKEDDHFIVWLKGKGTIVITEELERFTADNEDIKKAWDALRLMESELCMPFIYKGEVIGFLNLGAKGDRSMYNHEDIELFLSLGKQASIAIKNAQLIEQIKESKNIIRRMDRLKTIGDMAAGLAHEIRNPLVPIKTCLELLPERYGKDKEFTERIPPAALQEVERIEALLKEIMDYSRPRSPVLKENNINDIVEKTVIFVEYEAKKKGIKIDREFDNELPMIKVDNEQIKQVLLNLIINAIDAVNGRGRISIKTHKAAHALSPCGKIGKGEYVQIEITDNGAGIPEENLERIFNPFYTTKYASKEREGTGLGLAIVQEIVTEHCGFIQVRSELGKGSTFLVNLPIDCSEFANIVERRK